MKKNIKLINIFIIFIFFIIALHTYKIINEKYHIGIPCIFNKITNLYCPGCGITRALFALIELDIKTALRSNILIFILMPFMLVYMINYIYLLVNNKKNDVSQIFNKKIWYALLFITILFGIIRNINYFHWLQPI